MGFPSYRIEVITSVSGIDFENSYASRVIYKIEGVEISIISKNDLIENKQAAGRNKDLDDIENLK